MKIFPATSKERWGLLLFPFRAYIVVGPLFFFFWDLGTSGHRMRGAYAATATVIGFGFLGCLVAFITAGLVLFFSGRRSSAITNFALAILVFVILFLWSPICASS
jgi:hypothetical protein